jgi:hypothetical protein
LNTYHIKYSAQVYLEGVPGFCAVLCVYLFEHAVPAKEVERQRRGLLIASAAAMGLAAAGKYLYGIVGFVLLPFLFYRTRSWKSVVSFLGISLLIIFAADPFLWANPPARLWESLTYHWNYSHGEHVVSAGMPWYSPFVHLLRAAPTHWHPGVFYTGIADVIVLPLAIVGIKRSIRERPIWLAWAAFGLFFLLLWPTKWPQYILIVLPALYVCAGVGIKTLLVMFSPRRLKNTKN